MKDISGNHYRWDLGKKNDAIFLIFVTLTIPQYRFNKTKQHTPRINGVGMEAGEVGGVGGAVKGGRLAGEGVPSMMAT